MLEWFCAEGQVQLPGSKSLSNRLLLLAALSEGETAIENLLDSDDVNFMLGALKALGIEISDKNGEGESLRLKGCSGRFPTEVHWFSPPLQFFSLAAAQANKQTNKQKAMR